MKRYMDRGRHHADVQRALALGRASDPAGLPELIALCRSPANEVRRLAASAISKLAAFGTDANQAVAALALLALHDAHPQVQQYALKGLKAYAATAAGTLVQSDGERIIAEWLTAHDISFRYDNRFRIIKGYAIRPDFYLPEYDLYIEYWGMETIDYKIGMLEKQKKYQQAGKKLLSFYRREKPQLTHLLAKRLSRYIKLEPPQAKPKSAAERTPSRKPSASVASQATLEAKQTALNIAPSHKPSASVASQAHPIPPHAENELSSTLFKNI